MRRQQAGRNRRGIARIHPERRGIYYEIDFCELRAQCCFIPPYRFEARRGTE